MPLSPHDMPLPAEWPTTVPMAISWTGPAAAAASAPASPAAPSSLAEGALPAWSAAPAALAEQAAQLAFNATLPGWDETPPQAELASLAAALALHLSLQPEACIGFDAAAVLDPTEDAPEPSREELAQALGRLLRSPAEAADRLWFG
ncbi:hypothetical protein [Pseudoroseomonas cervicalis]|uniref:hypothetical protein n=1 Tax=Teichococcus cervicalis TaxID=204525 RepID=UPI00277E4D1C|nr:hypothetical protein [Pseudoroseomonas cervicalis]MDQ1080186.1 hypothetical protein [Pseudoroseomonas cervicalis]